MHTQFPDYSQHAAEEINGSCVGRPQVGRAWRENDPSERPATRAGFGGDNWQSQRPPKN